MRGEIVALLGPNGAGKTTLLKVASTLLVPDAGRVLVAGADPFGGDPLPARRRIGIVVAQESSFYWSLTGRENLDFFAALRGLSRAEAAAAIGAVAARIPLGPALDRPYRTLSSGERLRLGIARALLGEPEILLLDEPTRSLDPVAKEDVWRILREEACRGRCVLLATHDLLEASTVAARVIVLAGGRVAWAGPLGGDLAARYRAAVAS